MVCHTIFLCIHLLPYRSVSTSDIIRLQEIEQRRNQILGIRAQSVRFSGNLEFLVILFMASLGLLGLIWGLKSIL